ncbi:MAG: response regulator [Bacteroidetes bacterium]|jgi:signal transduction histidine kinase|nr:response regulator [Bacteroidota bacterium]
MSKKAILCVDDEVIVLDSLKEQIQNALDNEYIIETAENGQEAMEVFDELLEDNYEVPVVIADYIMPEITGDKVLEYIHTKHFDTRTILLTGQANLQGVENAVNKANLYRFISKPWDKEDLILTIKEALRSFEQDKTISRKNTELQELNASLEQKVEIRTTELSELNATKDKFFSIIAHDLKNPFNTLLGFSELLMTNLSNYSSSELEEFIGIIHQTSKNAYALLENLLEWSRSQTGRIKFQPDKLDMKLLVESTLQTVQNNALKKNITLLNQIKHPGTAFADENMIKTVIRNLLSNAIKFTDNEGEIKVYSKTEDNLIYITISDNGVGIKEKDLEKLFRIDVNHSTVGTENEMGTGLGLILCKEFIVKNGGEIWVESEYGKGSQFTFTLPIHENA